MKRVLEAELMDEAQQAQDYANADFAGVNQAFVERFMTLFPDLVAGVVADLGCGPGDIPIRLCDALPGITVFGVDGSADMLGHAREAIAAAGLSPRIELLLGRLPLRAPPSGPFAALVSNSLLHHLPDPGVLWAQINDLADAGTAVLVVDLLRPETVDEARGIVEKNAFDEPEMLQRDYYNSLLASFTLEEVGAQLAAAGLCGLQLETISDRHFAVFGRMG